MRATTTTKVEESNYFTLQWLTSLCWMLKSLELSEWHILINCSEFLLIALDSWIGFFCSQTAKTASLDVRGELNFQQPQERLKLHNLFMKFTRTKKKQPSEEEMKFAFQSRFFLGSRLFRCFSRDELKSTGIASSLLFFASTFLCIVFPYRFACVLN